MNKRKISNATIITFFIFLSISGIYLTTPVKASKITIEVVWSRLYLKSQTYDNSGAGEFRVQVKYYTGSKWVMDESKIFKVETSEIAEILNPKITFRLGNDVELGHNIYYRLIEDDGLAKDDQIVKPYFDNTGGKIGDGTWDVSYTLNSAGWRTLSIPDAVNANGDWFRIYLINLDY
ncbi:MAG: hypothetical protein ACTSVB_03910 [Candidatus Heimdallarchaeaceae archaeon]